MLDYQNLPNNAQKLAAIFLPHNEQGKSLLAFTRKATQTHDQLPKDFHYYWWDANKDFPRTILRESLEQGLFDYQKLK